MLWKHIGRVLVLVTSCCIKNYPKQYPQSKHLLSQSFCDKTHRNWRVALFRWFWHRLCHEGLLRCLLKANGLEQSPPGRPTYMTVGWRPHSSPCGPLHRAARDSLQHVHWLLEEVIQEEKPTVYVPLSEVTHFHSAT